MDTGKTEFICFNFIFIVIFKLQKSVYEKLGVFFIDTGFISESRILPGILIVSLLLSLLVTYFIAQRIGKALDPKYKRWLYLLISLLPLKEMVGIVASEKMTFLNWFLWFWLLYWLFCLFMFWKSRIKQSWKTE